MITSIDKDCFKIDYAFKDKTITNYRLGLEDLVNLIDKTTDKLSKIVIKKKAIKFYKNKEVYANIHFASEHDLLFVLSKMNITNLEN